MARGPRDSRGAGFWGATWLAEVVESAVGAAHHGLDLARVGVGVPEPGEILTEVGLVHGPSRHGDSKGS